jgi:hypothetical protein
MSSIVLALRAVSSVLDFRRSAVVVVALLLALCGQLARAAPNLPSDLDSLVFMSSHIVEARVIGASAAGNQLVQITGVEMGTLKVGQTVQAGNLFDHTKPGSGSWGGGRQPLAPGDQLLLFLQVPAGKMACVDAGMFLIVRGKACRFGVERPPRWMGDWPQPQFRQNSPTVKGLRSAIATSLVRCMAWHARLDLPADPKNVPWLLSLLRQRAVRYNWFDQADGISDAAAGRLAELEDLGVADRAIAADPQRTRFFAPLFSSPAGQAYLLQQIVDARVPSIHRQKLFAVLIGTEGVHRAYFRYADSPIAGLGLARLARLASRVAEDDEPLTAAVLQAIEWPLMENASDPNCAARIRADVNGCADVLCALYKRNSTPDAEKYWIERDINATSYSMYQGLNPSSGPIMTLAAPLDLSLYVASSSPSVLLGYQWRCAVPYAKGKPPTLPPVTAAYLVLQPSAGGTPYVLPSPMGAMSRPSGAGGGGDCIPLPPGFRPGKYRLHYRLMSGSSVLSEGHGYEFQIPQPGLRVLPASGPRPAYRPPSFVWRAAWTTWVETIAVALTTLFLLRHAVRARRRLAWFRNGRCHRCGYDLRASGSRCSECGTVAPARLPTQILRRRFLRVAGWALLLPALAIAVLEVRSYFAADVAVHTSTVRADSAYTSRGSAVIQWYTAGSDPGWSYEREDPADLPHNATEIGAVGALHAFGAEYAPQMHLLILPLWMPLLLAVFLSICLIRVSKSAMVLPTSRTGINRIYELVMRCAAYPIRLRPAGTPSSTSRPL